MKTKWKFVIDVLIIMLQPIVINTHGISLCAGQIIDCLSLVTYVPVMGDGHCTNYTSAAIKISLHIK